MSEFTDELKRLDLEINLPSKTHFAIEEKFKDWQPPKPLVEVPRIIADWIELINQRNRNVLTLLDSDDMPDDVYDWLFIKEDDENINLILLAWIDGYTVEKEKKYYLCEKNTGYYLNKKGNSLKLVVNPYFDDNNEFTQSEIDELNIGSYEQIPVKVDEV